MSIDTELETMPNSMIMMMNLPQTHHHHHHMSSFAHAPTKRSSTRCAFWPNCEKGDQCVHVHPSKPCIAFPNCPYGPKCHFIHPTCRYDGHCTRPDCIFAHMAKNQQSAIQTSTSDLFVSTTTTDSNVDSNANPLQAVESRKVDDFVVDSSCEKVQEEPTLEPQKQSNTCDEIVVTNPYVYAPANKFYASNSSKYTLINRANSNGISIPIVSIYSNKKFFSL